MFTGDEAVTLDQGLMEIRGVIALGEKSSRVKQIDVYKGTYVNDVREWRLAALLAPNTFVQLQSGPDTVEAGEIALSAKLVLRYVDGSTSGSYVTFTNWIFEYPTISVNADWRPDGGGGPLNINDHLGVGSRHDRVMGDGNTYTTSRTADLIEPVWSYKMMAAYVGWV
jgi:hypothetical protein